MTKKPTKAEQRRAEMDEAFDKETGGNPEAPQQPAPAKAEKPAPTPEPAVAAPAVDGRFFLHATAGSRTDLTKDEYDALVVALRELRKGAPE